MYIYAFARISKFMHCRHVVPGCDLLHPAVRLLPLHGRQRHGDLQQYQQVRAIEFLFFNRYFWKASLFVLMVKYPAQTSI